MRRHLENALLEKIRAKRTYSNRSNLAQSTGVVECLPLLDDLLGALVGDTGQVPISRSAKPAR